MPYNMAAFRAFADYAEANVYVVYRDHKKVSQYQPVVGKEGMKFIPRSSSNRTSLVELVKNINPKFVFISGWVDRTYMAVAFAARRAAIPVIVGLDNQWKNSTRQRVLAMFFKIFRKFFFTGAFVPGTSQYFFARKLGFSHSQIRTGAYTADVSCFNMTRNYSPQKSILFIGRLVPIKGIDLLTSCFLRLTEEEKFSDWKLIIIGSGTLLDSLPKKSQLVYQGFLPQEEIAKLAEQVSFFCLPSVQEPWGLVVHEMAAAGLPVLLSDACGSAEDFLVEGYNGLSFRTGDAEDLSSKLRVMMELPFEQLKEMGVRSRTLASKNSPAIWSYKLMSLAETWSND